MNGYVAGPNQNIKEPLRVGGERLHDWIIPLAELELQGATSKRRESLEPSNNDYLVYMCYGEDQNLATALQGSP